MSDINVVPPGALVWLASLAWCGLCVLALVVFLLIAWQRTKKGERSFARDRFVGYALGAWLSGILAGLTMSLINWSGSLGTLARWLDQPAASAFWLGMIIVSAPAGALAWNHLRKARL